MNSHLLKFVLKDGEIIYGKQKSDFDLSGMIFELNLAIRWKEDYQFYSLDGNRTMVINMEQVASYEAGPLRGVCNV